MNKINDNEEVLSERDKHLQKLVSIINRIGTRLALEQGNIEQFDWVGISGYNEQAEDNSIKN